VPVESDGELNAGRVETATRQRRPARALLGRLATYIASFAGGMAVNDVSGTLGYHGLAGAVALSGVVTAAVGIRGLDPRARLSRYAPRVFLMLAGCAAAIAAFSSGPIVSALTALAAVLTVGAVLVAKELESVALLLLWAAGIAGAAALIALGAALITHNDALLGAALIALGAAIITAPAAGSTHHDTLFALAVIVGLAALITAGAVLIAHHDAPLGAALIVLGPSFVAGVAGVMGPAIVPLVREWVEWATKAPPSSGQE
jgi:hypothetical protein